MTEDELWDALDGLIAWYVGATDSGYQDSDGTLRKRVREFYEVVGADEFGALLERLAAERLTDGYDDEDREEFIERATEIAWGVV